MFEFFDISLTQRSWFKPLVIITLLFPFLVVLFNEFIFRAQKKEKRLVPPVRMMRNIILPLVAIFVIMTQLVGFSRETIFIKIIETLLYILFLNALVAIINVLFFSRGSQSLLKTRIPQLFLDIFRVVLVLLGTAIILSAVWGTDLANMITALGVGSFVLGLALQDTLGNLFAGIALIYEKPFSVGDFIQVDDNVGRVVEMNWRTVRLIDLDDVLIVVPHLIIGSSTVMNLSVPSKSHLLSQTLNFSSKIPPHQAKKALLKTMLNTPGIVNDPFPVVITKKYKRNHIKYQLDFAVANYEDGDEILDDLMTRIWYLSKRNRVPYLATKNENLLNSENGNYILQELKVLLTLFPIKEEHLKSLKSGAIILMFGVGEYIIKKRDMAGDLYVIKSGKVKIIFEKEESTRERYLYGGDFFGDIGILPDRQCSFSVQVMEDTTVLKISHSHVVKLIKSNPKLVYYLNDMTVATGMT